MNNLNEYIIEKLKLDKYIRIINPTELYHEGDYCLELINWDNIIHLEFIKIREINWDKNQIWFAQIEYNAENDLVKVQKYFSYKFKNIKKYDYLNIVKSYGVEEDRVIIPQDKVEDVFNEILNNKMNINFHKYMNLPSKMFKVASGLSADRKKIYPYTKEYIENSIKFIKKYFND